MKVKVKSTWAKQAKEVSVNFGAHGQNAFVSFGEIVITDDQTRLWFLLQSLADALKPSGLGSGFTTRKPLPAELEKAETAWPWLLENMPQIFDGVNLEKEPYSHYIKTSLKTCALSGCEELVTSETAIYCSNACKQAAYRARKAA